MKPDPKDKKNMVAADMFAEDLIQVFSKRTGQWIGTVKPGEEDTLEDIASPSEVKKEQNKNQLSIF